VTVTLSPLDYYRAHGAALFPIPAGQKNPIGIVKSFAHDFSTDPAQWDYWAATHPGCNWGVVAGPSQWIIVDTDAKDDRDAAWAARCELFAEWGVSPNATPHVQSARGGWHDIFAVPVDVDARTLRQPDAVKKLINIRAGNGFVVAAGSYYEGTPKGEASGPYLLLSDLPPHPAPAALIAHCTRVAHVAMQGVLGTRDIADVAALITWLAERTAFASYEDWVGVGMALKLEFGDAGLALWSLAHDSTVTSDVEATKWRSFASEPTPGVQTLNTIMDRAHRLGWKGTVRKPANIMFDGVGQVASIAANAGATLQLPPGTPGPAGGSGVPMLEGQAELARIGAPILQEFLTATADSPMRPTAIDYPTLPESASGHGLYSPLLDVIDRIIAMAETPKTFKQIKCINALGVLQCVHEDTCAAVLRRVHALGCTLNGAKIKLAAARIAEESLRAFVPLAAWLLDGKGFPENDNSDNVAIFLEILGLEIRWNAWLERAEIFGGEWRTWTYIDDTVVAKLRTRGNRTHTRFRPSKEFFWESLLALAHINTVDPVVDALATLQTTWDGQYRLAIWLTQVCGVPCDPYHQSVGKNIIGGMVRRARQPGCQHDTMAVLYGFQGSGKSTLAAILALQPGWFSDSILLGDASKELVLSLAGKLVVEISEMGMRGSANPAHVKAMISRRFDAGRTAYARSVSERQRRNIFIGTTNDDTPLIDPTGNRRFLPVHVPQEIDLTWLRANIGQLIAEACVAEAAGATFALPRSVWGDAAERQEAARVESDVEVLLADWFGATQFTAALSYVTAADLANLSKLAGWRGSKEGRSAIMKSLGFRQENAYIGGKKSRVWVRGLIGIPGWIERDGVRYMVGTDNNNLPRVTISHGNRP